MRAGWRIAIYSLVVGAAVLALGGELILRSVAVDRLRALVEEDLVEATGITASIGEMHLELFPTPHLEASDVRLGGGDADAVSVRIGLLQMRVELRPLLRREIVIDAIGIEDVDLRIILPDEVDDSSLAASIREFVEENDDDGARLRVRRLHALRARTYVRNAASREFTSTEYAEIDIRALELDGPVFVAVAGAMDGTPFEVRGKGGPIRELLVPTKPYPIEARGTVFDAEIDVVGTLSVPLDLRGLELDVNARIPDLAITGLPLPNLGPITFVGRLSDLDGSLGFEQLVISTKTGGEPIDGHIEGHIDDLADVAHVELEARVEATRLDFVRQWFAGPLPSGVSADARVDVSDADGSLGAIAQMHAVGPNGAVELDVRGRYGDLVELSALDVEIEVSARDLDALADLFEPVPALPGVGPVRASARLRDRDGVVALEDIRIDVAKSDGPAPWATLRGSVGDLVGRSNVSLAGEFSVLEAERFAAAFGRSLPPIGPIQGSAMLSDRDGSLGLEEIRLKTPGDGPVEVKLSAKLDDLIGRDEISVDAEVRSRDLAVLGSILERDLPAIGPVFLRAKIRGSDELLTSDAFDLSVGESRIAGQLHARFPPGERPFLKAHLESPRARLVDFWPEPAASRDTEPFSLEKQLPLDSLRSIDLDIGIRIDHWEGAVGVIHDLKGALWLEDGKLLLSDVGARYRKGQVDLNAQVDATRPLPVLALRLDAVGVDLAKLLSQLDNDAEATGLADLHLDLKSEGFAVYQMILALNGRARAVIRDGTVVSKYANRFVVDLARTAFPFLKGDAGPARIGCALADFSIEDGIVTAEEVFLEEGDIVIVGSGHVDLPAGQYHLRFDPEARNQGLLSVAPVVEVSGPLEAPVFDPIKRTVVSSLGRGVLSAIKRAGMKIASPLRSLDDASDRAASACASVGLEEDEG